MEREDEGDGRKSERDRSGRGHRREIVTEKERRKGK